MKIVIKLLFLTLIVVNLLICSNSNVKNNDLVSIKLTMNSAFAQEGVSDKPCITIGSFYSQKHYAILGGSCTDSENKYCGNSQNCNYSENSTTTCQSWWCKQFYP